MEGQKPLGRRKPHLPSIYGDFASEYGNKFADLRASRLNVCRTVRNRLSKAHQGTFGATPAPIEKIDDVPPTCRSAAVPERSFSSPRCGPALQPQPYSAARKSPQNTFQLKRSKAFVTCLRRKAEIENTIENKVTGHPWGSSRKSLLLNILRRYCHRTSGKWSIAPRHIRQAKKA